MKKTFIGFITLLFAIQISTAQVLPFPSLPKGWKRIYIKNMGNFDLPPTMVVQQGKYKEFVDDIKKIKGFDTAQLTAQQKGLNEFKKKGFEKYARVMIETTFSSIGDFEKLNFNIATYTQADISKLNIAYKQQLQQSFIGTGLKFIEWHPLKVEKVNGMSCIHISYKRQLNTNPSVLVNMYIFHNNDRMHTFTLSYRLSESDYWQTDFNHILRSFRITKIR